MRILIRWGSKHGGAEGIGQMLGEALSTHGFEVALSVEEATKIDNFEAVIIGGALSLIFFVTWAIGGMVSTMPWPKPKQSHT